MITDNIMLIILYLGATLGWVATPKVGFVCIWGGITLLTFLDIMKTVFP